MSLKQAAKRAFPRRWWDRLGALPSRIRRGTARPIPPGAPGPVRLNIGCGTDYREGFVNIDGSPNLPRVDRVIDFGTERLTDHFALGSVDHIVANDIVEHVFH